MAWLIYQQSYYTHWPAVYTLSLINFVNNGVWWVLSNALNTSKTAAKTGVLFITWYDTICLRKKATHRYVPCPSLKLKWLWAMAYCYFYFNTGQKFSVNIWNSKHWSFQRLSVSSERFFSILRNTPNCLLQKRVVHISQSGNWQFAMAGSRVEIIFALSAAARLVYGHLMMQTMFVIISAYVWEGLFQKDVPQIHWN